MTTTTRNDILGMIDYLNDKITEWAYNPDTEEWGNRCIAWITDKLEQETTK
jgi:hypothetical protein